MSELHLIGIDGGPLRPEAEAALLRAAAVVTSDRFRPLLHGFAGEVLTIAPLAAALAQIEKRLARDEVVAVLASGDPLFFGIGRTLFARFGQGKIVIHPALSSMQLAFARLKEPWDEAACLSLHGRADQDILPQLLRHGTLFLFTDRQRTPATIARRIGQGLAELGLDEGECRIMVAEHLGLEEERISHGAPKQIAALTWAEPNVMILRLSAPAPQAHEFRLGLTESEIVHSRGLITKDEVRAAILHRLRLPRRGVLWDIGAGSGSLACEAARLCPELTVLAIERSAEQQAHINTNRRAFQLANLHLVSGPAPAALADLPQPDRVFIGGSGGALASIIDQAATRLATDGRIVVSAVTEATRAAAPALLHGQGLAVTMTTVSVCRETFPPQPEETKNLNPITIITGTK